MSLEARVFSQLASAQNLPFKMAVAKTWTPKVCKILSIWGIFVVLGLGLSFYILLGSRNESRS